MHLGILLTGGFGHASLHTCREIARAAASRGHTVSVFLMDDGVVHAGALAEWVRNEAGGQRVSVAVCAHNAMERGVAPVEGALFGSQADWAQIVARADRVIRLG